MSDLFIGAELRDAGIERIEASNSDWVHQARCIAILLAVRNGQVTANDVYDYMKERCLPCDPHPNAWGSVFKCKQLRFSGRVTESRKNSRHAGILRIWEHVPENWLQ